VSGSLPGRNERAGERVDDKAVLYAELLEEECIKIKLRTYGMIFGPTRQVSYRHKIQLVVVDFIVKTFFIHIICSGTERH